MNPVFFLTDYVRWHYSNALLDILRVWGNFLWFVMHVSSFVELLRTLFSPWKRMHEEKPPKGTFDPEYYLGSITVNFIMRIVGFLARSAILAIALATFITFFILGIVFIAFWVLAPFAIFYLFFNGLALIS